MSVRLTRAFVSMKIEASRKKIKYFIKDAQAVCGYEGARAWEKIR